MVLVSSPLLIDHAIGRVFADFGYHDVRHVRTVLTVIRDTFGGNVPVATVLRRCLPGATLDSRYASMTLSEVWEVLSKKEAEERQNLINSFKSFISTATPA